VTTRLTGYMRTDELTRLVGELLARRAVGLMARTRGTVRGRAGQAGRTSALGEFDPDPERTRRELAARTEQAIKDAKGARVREDRTQRINAINIDCARPLWLQNRDRGPHWVAARVFDQVNAKRIATGKLRPYSEVRTLGDALAELRDRIFSAD
jgi:hypothetical protein